MKKIYQTPLMEELGIDSCEMLAASLSIFEEAVNGEDVLAPEFDDVDALILDLE
jgi:hypothetical protein